MEISPIELKDLIIDNGSIGTIKYIQPFIGKYQK